MTESTRLIVLKLTPLSDSLMCLHSLSSRWGRRSFLVSASKSRSLYLPLTVLDAEAVVNPKSDLWRLKNAQAVSPLNGIRTSMSKNAISLFLSEVLYRTVTDGSDEPGLFDWCEKSIMTLDALQGDFSNFHIRWLLEFCVALGFAPAGPSDFAPFALRDYETISAFLSGSFARCMLIPLDGKRRTRIAASILEYISAHTETHIEAKSLEVLSELFVS